MRDGKGDRTRIIASPVTRHVPVRQGPLKHKHVEGSLSVDGCMGDIALLHNRP